jgi:serine/threonine protein kinase
MEPLKFGRYVIKEELGRGGMSTVYHAYDPRFEREVALKVLPREMLHDPQFRTRFEREAKTIAMLEHPAIVPVYDFGEEDGQPYFVMRFMTGGSLSERMKKGPMSLQDVADLFDCLAPALDEAHSKGIIHRDLKPGNILFDQYGEPYISDFGIAKITSTEANVTGSAIVGTPAYMSPEQAQGVGIDGRSDIYGLGVILFELLTRQQPYHGDTPMSVVVKHITDPVPRIRDIKPDLPPAIEAVINKAMAKDRDDRFPTVRALADALEAVAHGKSLDQESGNKTIVAPPKTVVVKSSSGGTKPPAPMGEAGIGSGAPRKKNRLWIGLAGIFVLVCLASLVGINFLKGKLPYRGTPTETSYPGQPTKTKRVLPPTNTSKPKPGSTLPPSASDTATFNPTSTFTPTVSGPTSIGGADLIAFLNNNDIWVMGVDGTNLTQITKDGAEKSDLQWSLDGQSLVYISGSCVDIISIPSGKINQITCFIAAEYLDAFEISPDGKQVAISLNRVIYVVPYDLDALKKARNWIHLRDMKGCFTYGPSIGVKNQAPAKTVKWSSDGKRLTVDTISQESGRNLDALLTFDITRCDSVNPVQVDFFPSTREQFPGYYSKPTIPFFDWDGKTLFLLNNKYHYEFGFLFGYNSEAKLGKLLSPMGTTCCYMATRFSPDGLYLLFAYQNINSPAGTLPQLFYIPYGTIDTGKTYTPFTLPVGFFNNLNDHIEAALRPVLP